jgi:succinyl-CoA synthetase beta subunit/citryl-CoA synthetase large subunit
MIVRLLEFEAKALLREYGIPVGSGRVIASVEEVAINGPSVLKAQVPVGGRGKAGGVVFVKNGDEARREASRLLGSHLRGYPVTRLLIEDRILAEKEYFLAVTYDMAAKAATVIFSAEGGVDIEELARAHPEKVVRESVSLRKGFHDYQARNIGLSGGLSGKELLGVSRVLERMVEVFRSCDATIVEINPLVWTEAGEIFACDAHIDIEDEALYRQKKLLERLGVHTRESGTREQTEFEKKAQEIDSLDHRGVAGRMIEFDGNLGLIIGGGGASLTCFDAVRKSGGRPANYCEIGGNPSVLKVKELTKHLLSKPGVDKIAVIMNVVSNTRVDLVARGVIKGILEAGKDPRETIAIFRIPGAWEEEGFKVLSRYGVAYCDRTVSIDEAAQRAVAGMTS